MRSACRLQAGKELAKANDAESSTFFMGQRSQEGSVGPDLPGETNAACVLTRARSFAAGFHSCRARRGRCSSISEEETKTQGSRTDHTANRGRAEAGDQICSIPKFTLFPALTAPNLQGFCISEAGLDFHFFVKPLICPSFISLTSPSPSEYLPAGAPQGPLVSEPA